MDMESIEYSELSPAPEYLSCPPNYEDQFNEDIRPDMNPHIKKFPESQSMLEVGLGVILQQMNVKNLFYFSLMVLLFSTAYRKYLNGPLDLKKNSLFDKKCLESDHQLNGHLMLSNISFKKPCELRNQLINLTYVEYDYCDAAKANRPILFSIPKKLSYLKQDILAMQPVIRQKRVASLFLSPEQIEKKIETLKKQLDLKENEEDIESELVSSIEKSTKRVFNLIKLNFFKMQSVIKENAAINRDGYDIYW